MFSCSDDPGGESSTDVGSSTSSSTSDWAHKDNSFRLFRKLCADVADENSHTGKTNIISKYLVKGNSGGMWVGSGERRGGGLEGTDKGNSEGKWAGGTERVTD